MAWRDVRKVGSKWGDAIGNFFSPGTQQTTSEPWAVQQPYLTDIFSQAQDLYNTGAPLTPDLSPETIAALNAQQAAGQNNPYLTDFATGIGGFSDYSNPYIGGFSDYQGLQSSQLPGFQNLSRGVQGIGSRALMNPAMQGLQNLPGLPGGIDTSLLQETAGGKFLGSNPFLDQMYERAAGKVGEQFQNITMPGISTAFSQAGRFGSPAQQEATQGAQKVLGETLGGLATDIYAPAYESERARQEAARQNLASFGLGQRGQDITGRGQNISALGTLGGLYGQGIGQQLQAAGLGADILGQQEQAQQYYNSLGLGALGTQAGLANQDAQTRLQALGMLPTARNMQLQDLGLLRDVGSTYDIFNQQQAMDPWRMLQMYGGAVGGQYGGTTTAPGQSPFERALGIGSDIAITTAPLWMPGAPPKKG